MVVSADTDRRKGKSKDVVLVRQASASLVATTADTVDTAAVAVDTVVAIAPAAVAVAGK